MNNYKILTPGMIYMVKDATAEKALLQLHLHEPGITILKIESVY